MLLCRQAADLGDGEAQYLLGQFYLAGDPRNHLFDEQRDVAVDVAAIFVGHTDDDPAGTASNYTAVIYWGDGTFSNAASIVANGSGGFDVTSDGHTYAEEAPWPLRVVVTDADMSLVDAVRGTLPSLANRREDVFGKPVAVPLRG